MGLSTITDYDQKQSEPIRIALIGQGPFFDYCTRIPQECSPPARLLRAKIVGWVPSPDEPQNAKDVPLPAFIETQNIFADINALTASRSDIQLVFDISPNKQHGDAIAAAMPSHRIELPTHLSRFYLEGDGGCFAIGGGNFCESKKPLAPLTDNNNGVLRESQKLFALIVDQTDGDILILDTSGKVVDCNRHAAETRNTTREAIIGRLFHDLEPEESVCGERCANCAYERSRKSGKEAEHTFSHVDQDGRMRYFQAVCFPVTDVSGTPSQFLYIRRDITDKHALEQRLQQNEKMAAIGELSTYMAHEIRNPLFSIGGFANALLRSPSLDSLAREKARIIYDESRRLDVILQNILNFARPTEQDMGEFDAAAVTRQTVELMTIGSSERGIDVAVDIAPDLPKASGNAENLKQCLINLIKNATEAMPDGGTLSLRAHRNGDFVQIEVIDTGAGIPAEVQENIFSPFFTTKNKGSGLGLAMTRKVITDMGGNVTLKSALGKGTTVILEVPVALATSQESRLREIHL